MYFLYYYKGDPIVWPKQRVEKMTSPYKSLDNCPIFNPKPAFES